MIKKSQVFYTESTLSNNSSCLCIVVYIKICKWLNNWPGQRNIFESSQICQSSPLSKHLTYDDDDDDDDDVEI